MTSASLPSLGSLVQLADSGTWGDEAPSGAGDLVLRSSNIVENRLDVSGVVRRVIPTKHRKSKLLAGGDIVVVTSSGSPDHIAKCCLFSQDADRTPYYFSNFTLRLRTDPTKVMPRWLFYWLTSKRGRSVLEQMNPTTSGLRNLNKRLYLAQLIPVRSLAQQRRVGEILDTADAIRRKHHEALALQDRLLRAAFFKTFGDPAKNDRGWETVQLGELCEVQLGKMLSAKAHGGADPVPYLRNANVQWRRIDLSSVFVMDFSRTELAKFDLRPGDLLVCEGGEVGRCAIWEGQLTKCSFQKALHRVRPRDCRIRVEYLQELLYSLADVGALARSTSQATIAHLTKVQLQRLWLPLPPEDLQDRFVRLYRSILEARKRQEVRLDAASTLFDSLSHRAFHAQR